MISAVHLLIATAAWVYLSRALQGAAFAQHAPDASIASAFALAVLISSAAGSAAAIVAGRTTWSPSRALAYDVGSLAATVWTFAVISLGPWQRDLGGAFAVLITLQRLAPGALAIVRGAPAWLSLIVAFGAYGAMGAWLPVASLPLGDQIHYLLQADRLAHGSLDATFDRDLFVRTLGIPPSADDIGTHVALAPTGARPIQGYALSLLILPGWIAAGRLGADLVVALIAAWTSFQILLILRDIVAPRAAGRTWLIASACAPMSLLATHVYPDIVGAAVTATAFRIGFTAPRRRPAAAAAILSLALFLTPRNAVPALMLIGSLLRDPEARRRIAVACAAILAVTVAADAIVYGIPLPYAGYLIGTGQAQELTREGSITPFVWVTLPAILFDRTFGLAGSAAWVFIGLIGLAPALARDRARLLPAAVAFGLSVASLALFRLWEGGYAPPARYVVDVLPLWTPFVAYGLDRASAPVARGGVAVLLGLSAITSVILNAAPALALNTAFDDKIRDAMHRVLGIDPLGWLPSFVPLTPTWYVGAYLALVPALAIALGLVWMGRRWSVP